MKKNSDCPKCNSAKIYERGRYFTCGSCNFSNSKNKWGKKFSTGLLQ